MPVQDSNDCGEVGRVRADLSCDRHMLQAERLDGPRRVVCQDGADPSRLGMGEHGTVMVAEGAGLGPAAP